MNQVIKVYKQQVPAMKFVGKKYVGDDVYSHWGEWFANGWFDKVEEAMGGVDNILNIWIADDNGCLGTKFCSSRYFDSCARFSLYRFTYGIRSS